MWLPGKSLLDVREAPSDGSVQGRDCYREVASTLAELEALALAQPDETSKNALLRTVHGWQFLLAQHRSTGRRRPRCRLCGSSWRDGGWPCATWWIAYAQLCVVPDTTDERPSRLASPFPHSGRDGFPSRVSAQDTVRLPRICPTT
ncbi:hypothetical protein [Allokutzneria sp. NRRL B-24872]|uniref:hypothetical protein n=1 Tax=Allokutzneria sp. NRRL B-24872 TaxID=1137961 RepID=UPI0011782AF8|nr:hypothetical protein [Allokutzneria sp. NRRL B-24872]